MQNVQKEKPIRLERSLMEQARVQAALEHRSLPKQIEYWANLGQKVAQMLTADQMLELMQGFIRIKLEENEPERFDMDDVLGDLESSRKAGTLANRVTGSAVRYGIDPANPDRLVVMDVNGTRPVSLSTEDRMAQG